MSTSQTTIRELYAWGVASLRAAYGEQQLAVAALVHTDSEPQLAATALMHAYSEQPLDAAALAQTDNENPAMASAQPSIQNHATSAAAADARALLLHAMGGVDTTRFVVEMDSAASAELCEKYRSYISRCTAHEPVQYITGVQEFMSLSFFVDGVLVPRPETELLVERVLRFAGSTRHAEVRQTLPDTSGLAMDGYAPHTASLSTAGQTLPNTAISAADWQTLPHHASLAADVTTPSHDANSAQDAPLKLLDLCTGSGCVAVSAAHYAKTLHATAVDVSPAAIATCTKNAKANGVDGRVTVIQADILSDGGDGISAKVTQQCQFDVVTANPPYIKSCGIAGLDKKVHEHEPLLALDGGDDGLLFYRKIALLAPDYLKPGGMLCMEIGYDQWHDVSKIIESTAAYTSPQLQKDYSGLDRVVFCKKLKLKK